jgi:hypothetical protein
MPGLPAGTASEESELLLLNELTVLLNMVDDKTLLLVAEKAVLLLAVNELALAAIDDAVLLLTVAVELLPSPPPQACSPSRVATNTPTGGVYFEVL